MSIFEQASRLKLRFETSLGHLSVEDLWDLPLTSFRGASLDRIAIELHQEIENTSPISFVNDEVKTDPTVQLRFDIVKHIIDVKKTEAKEAALAQDKAERKRKLLAIMARKEDAELEGKSLDELRELLNGL